MTYINSTARKQDVHLLQSCGIFFDDYKSLRLSLRLKLFLNDMFIALPLQLPVAYIDIIVCYTIISLDICQEFFSIVDSLFGPNV